MRKKIKKRKNEEYHCVWSQRGQRTIQMDRQLENITETRIIFKEYCEVDPRRRGCQKSNMIRKCDETKKRPLLIASKTGEKKKELFHNLHKLRLADISVTQDLTKKQHEELNELIKDAKRKKESDH